MFHRTVRRPESVKLRLGLAFTARVEKRLNARYEIHGIYQRPPRTVVVLDADPA